MRWKKKKGQDMASIVDMEQYVNKKESRVKSYSIIDMIFDPEYRKKTFEYYDNNYKETNEENEIFKSWQKHRIKKDD